MQYGGKMSAEMQKCIDACMESYSYCEQAIAHCLKQGGQYADIAVMGPLMDCVDAARACADMMIRQSPMAMDMAAACAHVAEMCADACMTMSSDATMKRCADACRGCAEACHALAGVRA